MADRVPQVMRAVLLTGHGSFECLQLRADVPVPRPQAGEVLVRIAASAVNNTDINLRIGWYSRSVEDGTDQARGGQPGAASDAGWDGGGVPFPLIQGADGCGRIVAVGADVSAARIGERVLLDPVLRPAAGSGAPYQYLGTDRPGCFAEYVALPAANAVAIDSDWSDVELASFPCSGLAAENMLVRAAVASGDRVLVTGASGGVGSAAVQLARQRGAEVIAIASDAKAAAVRQLGASRVLGRDAALLPALGAGSVDVVIDCVGGEHFESVLQVLRRGGRYAVAGAIAGPLVRLDLRTLYLQDLSLLGCTIPQPQVFQGLVACIERGDIRPQVARTYPLASIVAAQTEFLTRRHVGKIALVV